MILGSVLLWTRSVFIVEGLNIFLELKFARKRGKGRVSLEIEIRYK